MNRRILFSMFMLVCLSTQLFNQSTATLTAQKSNADGVVLRVGTSVKYPVRDVWIALNALTVEFKIPKYQGLEANPEFSENDQLIEQIFTARRIGKSPTSKPDLTMTWKFTDKGSKQVFVQVKSSTTDKSLNISKLEKNVIKELVKVGEFEVVR
jgi:hypothetical protein